MPMHQRTVRLLAVLFLAVLSACGNEPQLSPLSPDAVILAFGDSLTYGTGTTNEKSYPAVLQQLSGREVVNAGIPGDVTAGGVSRLGQTLDEVQPQLLLLCLGGNDLLHKEEQQKTVQNLEQMIKISRDRGVPVVLLGVPRPALFGMESADFYYEIAGKLSVPLEADIIPAVLSSNALKSDPIHPNAEGYRLIAEKVYEKLKETGAL